MKVGKLYKAKRFHHKLDDYAASDDDGREDEFNEQIKRGWDPNSPWALSLNLREDWCLGEHGNEWIPITPGQIVMVLTVEQIPENERIFDVGLLINDKRYAASFNLTEWSNRFQEVGNTP